MSSGLEARRAPARAVTMATRADHVTALQTSHAGHNGVISQVDSFPRNKNILELHPLSKLYAAISQKGELDTVIYILRDSELGLMF